MRRLLTYAAGLLLLPLMLLGAAPAQASTVGRITTSTAVLYRGCHHHTYRYDFRVPSQSWYLTVRLVGPAGHTVATDHPYEGPGTGTAYFQFCDYQTPGRYTIRASGDWYAETVDDTPHHFTLKPASFRVRKPRARARLRIDDATPRPGQRVHYKVRATGERPAAYRPLSDARVALQVRRGGRWHTVADATTGRRGRAVMTRVWHRRLKVRVRVWHAPYRPGTSRVHRVG